MAKFDHNDCIEEKDVTDCSYLTMSRDMEFPQSLIEKVKSQEEETIKNITDGKSNILKQSLFESR